MYEKEFRCACCEKLVKKTKDNDVYVPLLFDDCIIPYRLCTPCRRSDSARFAEGIYYNTEADQILLVEKGNEETSEFMLFEHDETSGWDGEEPGLAKILNQPHIIRIGMHQY